MVESLVKESIRHFWTYETFLSRGLGGGGFCANNCNETMHSACTHDIPCPDSSWSGLPRKLAAFCNSPQKLFMKTAKSNRKIAQLTLSVMHEMTVLHNSMCAK